ncbi:MAG: aldo/keto reductase [Clostridiales bacterium]|nr:aldo/keto reductase [Clostridiales bacterium]
MKYGSIPGLDRPVSRFIFGTAHPAFFSATRSLHEGEDGFEEALHKAFALLDDVYAMGVNLLDCSAHYGEEPVGEWLAARGLQGKVFLLTKGGHHNRWRKRVTPYDILSDAHDSLAKLGVSTVDIYLLHRDDPTQPVGPIMEALNELKRQGKINLLGVSNWTLPRLQEANAYAREHGLTPFTVSSPHYGLAEQLTDVWGGGCTTLTGKAAQQEREWYIANKMTVLAYSSLARGLFSGRFRSGETEKMRQVMDEFGLKGYVNDDNLKRLARAEVIAGEMGVPVSEIALAWMLGQPLDVFPIVSTSHAELMRSNVHAGELTLSDSDRAWLNLERDKR